VSILSNMVLERIYPILRFCFEGRGYAKLLNGRFTSQRHLLFTKIPRELADPQRENLSLKRIPTEVPLTPEPAQIGT